MSRDNVELVRRGFEIFNSGDIDRILSFTGADFEIEVPPGLSAEPDTYRGAEGVRRYFQSFDEAMDEVHFQADRFWDAAEAVVVDALVTARGKRTAIPVEQRAAQLWTIRGGRVIRIRAYASLPEALETVGLAE
ncbi:MAG TPA: nuclear transport factor 2 family protein [Solirubrobacteraceae bacterium]|jgi:ketosteroid isomerase-like protein|nr:nuclear transport factor 2 family protein [Solirubrobacteraceae bacterium]